MARFHPLEVADLRHTTRDAVVVSLRPVNGGDFGFTQGQYLTFRKDLDGTEIRRSYSICAGRDEGVLRVGIKRVEGGAFSTWANEALKPGDLIEAMAPQGNFHAPLEPDVAKSYLCVAGGSGITPVLSILKTTLAAEPQSRFTLIYANRGVSSIMFREELEDLKNIFLDRFRMIHILEHDAQEIDLFTGRLDPEKCTALFAGLVDVARTDMAFICGPEPMMLTVSGTLQSHGLAKDRIKFELFASNQPGRLAQRKRASGVDVAKTDLSVTIDGATRALSMDKSQSVLEAALAHDLDAPFACRAGVCSTCKCRLLDGEVEMLANHALEDYEVAQGFILSCQSYPLTDRIAVDYDQH